MYLKGRWTTSLLSEEHEGKDTRRAVDKDVQHGLTHLSEITIKEKHLLMRHPQNKFGSSFLCSRIDVDCIVQQQ